MTHRGITPGSSRIWIDLLNKLVKSIWGSVERGQCGMTDSDSDLPSETCDYDTENISHIFLHI